MRSASVPRVIDTFDVAGLTTQETPNPSATRFGAVSALLDPRLLVEVQAIAVLRAGEAA